MLWKLDTQVTLLSVVANHIDVVIKWDTMDVGWRFTRIYGFLETHNKLKICDLIMDLFHH